MNNSPESTEPVPVSAQSTSDRPMRHYDLVMAAFVAVLLLSNVSGAAKLSQVSAIK